MINPEDYNYRIGDGEPFSILSPYNLVGTLGCGLWFLAYLCIMRAAQRDRAPGISALALCLNLSWELLGSFVWQNPIPLWRWFYRIWFLLDVPIFLQALCYGARQQRHALLRRHYRALLCGGLLLAGLGQWAFTRTFHDPLGFITAFSINLVMSVSFLWLYLERPDLRGLSLAAAWFKLLGTLCTAIECHFLLPLMHPEKDSFAFPNFLYASILLFDGLYVGLLLQARRRLARGAASVAVMPPEPGRVAALSAAAELSVTAAPASEPAVSPALAD